MKRISIFISSLILLTVFSQPFRSWAREIPRTEFAKVEGIKDTEAEAVIVKDDTVKGKLDSARVSGSRNRLEISFDYLKLFSLASPHEMKMEGSLGYISKINVGINAEFGYGEKTPEDFYKNAEYKVYGYYGRAGLSYYYPYNPGVNFIIGVRYAMAQYQDEAFFSVTSSLWDNLDGEFQRTGLEASWAEFYLGSESSVKGHLYFGFSFRMRFIIQADNFNPFQVYSIPGFGRSTDTIVPALNLYIKYLIPF